MDWSINWEIIQTIFFGAVCGYIASRLLGGEGFGFLGNIFIGIVGGVIGSWLFNLLKIELMEGLVGNFISSVGGAILLIFLLKFLNTKNNRKRRN